MRNGIASLRLCKELLQECLRQDFPHTVIFFPVIILHLLPWKHCFFHRALSSCSSWAVPISWRVTGATYTCSYSDNSSKSLWIRAAQEGLGYLAGELLCWCGASWSANPPRCQILHPPGFLCQSHHYLVKNKGSWSVSLKGTPSLEEQLDTGNSSNSTFVQAQEEMKMQRALALQRAQEKGQYPHPKEKSFSIHCEQEPWQLQIV